MAESRLSVAIWAGVIGIIGAVIGSASTGYINALSNEKQQRTQAVIESFKFDHGDYPEEFFKIKQLIDEMRYLSFASSDTISKLAKIQEKYPGCSKILTDSCRAAYVETIQVMRDEAGSGEVNSRDIDIVIRGKYEDAQKALERFTND